jgi:uncharacterized protein (TIGR04255 family)
MSLNFPHKPDVQLKNSPLVEVVCQVRFPAILRIPEEIPSAFQEHIRSQFPYFESELGLLVQLPKLGAKKELQIEAPRTHRFLTSDKQNAISLAVDFYALTSNNYTTWENFSQYLDLVHKAMQAVYAPVYATRIGLRHINRVTLDNTGCATTGDLLDLFRPELTAQLRSKAWSDPVEMRNRLVLTDGDAKLTMSTGYGEERGQAFFLLDFDYFEEGQLSLDDLIGRCKNYNNVIYCAFRWCIRDNGFNVFRPKEKEALS